MRKLIALIVGMMMLLGFVAPSGADPVPELGAGVTVSHTSPPPGGSIQVTACLVATPTCPGGYQTVLSTPARHYDGSVVTVTYTLEYLNYIPDQAQSSNGIGFELYEDGVRLERMGLYGSHQFNQDPMFGPITLISTLDGPETPPAGVHTLSIRVWKWQEHGDGYLRDGDAPDAGGIAKPQRLTVRYGL